MEGVPHTFRVTWKDSRGQRQSITTDENPTVLSHLRPVTEYSISVCTVLQSTGLESEPVHTNVCTKPSAPERLRVEEVRSRSVRLCWDTPTKMEGVSYTYSITYTCDGEEPKEQTTGSNSSSADLCDLKPGVEYSFSICTVLHNGSRSRACSAQAHTQPSPPGKLDISSVRETSVCLSWDRPTDMEGVPHTFRVIWGNSRGQRESITTDGNPTVLSHLRRGTKYSISVCTVLQSTGLESEPVHTTVYTDSYLKQLVSGLGLENYLLEKLTLMGVLEIRNIENESTNSLRSLPWHFLRRLVMMNTTARDLSCPANQEPASQDADRSLDDDSPDE
ncbi:hypothetical protein JZ751_021811, partial [Albula glossodonta]